MYPNGNTLSHLLLFIIAVIFITLIGIRKVALPLGVDKNND